MPLYEYRCNDCGTEFEMNLRFSESDLLPACPACQGSHTRKKLSAVASLGNTNSGSTAGTGAACGGGGRFT